MAILIRLFIVVSVLLTRLFALPETNKTDTPKDCDNHLCEATLAGDTNLHYKKHGCYCDALCNFYNDCCRGYNPRTLSRIETPTTECRSPTKYNDPIMMIVSCATDFKGSQHIVENCQTNGAHIIKSIPVSGRKKQLVYRNMYCALCNGETNYTFWNTKFSCPHKMSADKLRMDKLNLTECHQSLQNPYPNTSHLCSKFLVRSCRNSTTGKCETGNNGVVFSSSGVFYKNFYCFQCNRQPEEELFCENLPSEKELTTPYAYSVPSYFILIDFNRRDVRLNGNDQLMSCPHGHYYDYVKRKCIHALHFENNSTIQVLNCSLERLQDNEYTLLPNQSIYRNSTKTFYDKDSYVMSNNSDVFICHNKRRRWSSLETSLSLIGMGISLSALAFLIFFYLMMPAIWNLTGLIYLSFSFSLFLAQSLFLISRYTTPVDACHAIATTMHYAFLVSFFWLNVVTVNIWMTVCRDPCEMISRKGWRRFFIYSLYAWLAPLLIIIPALVLDKHRPDSQLAPGYGYNGVCWLNNNAGILLFFAAPLAVIILFNIAAYLHTAITIYKMRQFAVQNSGKGNIKIIIINAKLCFLTGITWCFGYIATAVDSQELRIVFVILNATYGLWLAICFLSTENVFAQLKQKFRYVTQTSSTKTLS